MNQRIAQLLDLSWEIGREDRPLALLGEGNSSVKLDATRFAVKASGCCLASLSEADLTICETAKALAILNQKSLKDEAVDQALLDSRVDAAGKKPSIESMFHAWLLTLDGINFVGHCHPLAANQILSVDRDCQPTFRSMGKQYWLRQCPHPPAKL